VVDAIARGDEIAARDAMETHCTIGGTAFADMIAAMHRPSSSRSMI
jgi:DNA-binding FadR family transcriptional regulator